MDGDSESVTVSNEAELFKIFRHGDTDFDVNVKLSRYVAAPVKEGEALGSIIFSKDGKEIGRLSLTAEKSVNKKGKRGFFSF